MGTKQYERIFQILGAVLLAAVVVGVIAVCFGNGARSGVKREIGASDYYSQEEISAAMDTAQEYFDDHFPGCVMTSFRYDEESVREAESEYADEIRQLADSSRETANNIQTINEQVIEAVQGLVVSSEKIVGYINENILPDYRAFVQGGQQYNDDATHIDNTMAEYAGEAQDILATMMEMTEAIEGISRAVEESANGVTDAATNIDSLVQSMSTVNGQMEENSTVAKNLKEESAAFACV